MGHPERQRCGPLPARCLGESRERRLAGTAPRAVARFAPVFYVGAEESVWKLAKLSLSG
jgi:hypothetical protein